MIAICGIGPITAHWLEPDKPGVEEEEDEWDYDDQGELVKVAKPALPESRYPPSMPTV